MNWWYKKLYEDEKIIRVAYSYEENQSCDGILVYNKETKAITVEKMSDGADEFDTGRAKQHLYGCIRDNLLSFDKVRRVAIG
jgi:hypothetical protein